MILALDTCLGGLSIAIGSEEGVLCSYHNSDRNQQSKLLAHVLNDMLQENHLHISDIKKAVINIGPGSFTGIRIGIAFLHGLNVEEVYTCNTLDLLWIEHQQRKNCIATIQANRGHFFCKQYLEDSSGKICIFSEKELLCLNPKTIIGHAGDSTWHPSAKMMLENYIKPGVSDVFRLASAPSPLYM